MSIPYKALVQHLVLSGVKVDIDATIESLKKEVEEFSMRNDLIHATVQEVFEKLPKGSKVPKLKLVVFGALCKKLPGDDGEQEACAWLESIEEFLDRNTGAGPDSLLGVKAFRSGGHYLWANEPKKEEPKEDNVSRAECYDGIAGHHVDNPFTRSSWNDL
mgnify:CR=1 FL=1